MNITKIKYNKNGKYEVIIDSAKYYFYEDVLIENNLLKPKNISSDELANLLDANSFYEGYYKILKYVTYKKRCKSEVLKKLSELKIKNPDKIISLLYNQNYLNDEKYIESYIHDMINLTLKGPNLIIKELNIKGFNKENIIKYLDYSYEFWEERIKKIINKKNYKNVSLMAYKEKLKKDFINLGYDYDMFNKYIENIQINENDAYKKLYDKCYLRYSKKYSGKELEFKINEYLYSKGFHQKNQ